MCNDDDVEDDDDYDDDDDDYDDDDILEYSWKYQISSCNKLPHLLQSTW